MFHQIINDMPFSKNMHIIIGAFDGLHRAHTKIIQETIRTAREKNEQSLIFSFEPLAKEYFHQEEFHGRLIPPKIKQARLEAFGADHTLITDFRLIKDLSEKEFIDILLSRTEHATIYSGDDFRVGKKDGETYKGDRISFVKEPEISFDGHICRSTNIRNLLTSGEITTANTLLGYEYKIYSNSTHGDKIGRTINFPTINIVPNQQVIPKRGVYFGELTIKEITYPTAIYVGNRPTMFGSQLRVEGHVIVEFPYKDLPRGTCVELSFIERIADEKTFQSIEEMKKMLYNYKQISLGLATKRYQ